MESKNLWKITDSNGWISNEQLAISLFAWLGIYVVDLAWVINKFIKLMLKAVVVTLILLSLLPMGQTYERAVVPYGDIEYP